MLEIRDAKKEEWKDIMALVWRTFLKFEAGEYPEEGTASFFAFITSPTLLEMFIKGEYIMKVAVQDDKIVGVVSMRNVNHLSLLFVEKDYHKQGIGKALVEAMCMKLKEGCLRDYITVNASPYANEFYHRIGFFDLSGETQNDGIIYVSMRRNI